MTLDEAKVKELRLVRQVREQAERDEAALLKEMGVVQSSAIADRHRAEEEGAALYDRLTPAEIVDLYTNNKEEWDRLMRAKEAAGLRKILRRS